MPVLRELGYVEERAARDRQGRVVWHVTPAGRDLLVALGEKPGREDWASFAANSQTGTPHPYSRSTARPANLTACGSGRPRRRLRPGA